MLSKKEKILFSREEIALRVKEMGEQISCDYREKDLLVISLLRGSFIFAADLIREMDIKLEVDFLTTSSYANEEKSSGDVEFLMEIRAPIKGRHILIVDDIVDSGNTMKAVKERILESEPASLKVAVMLDKPERREVDLSADYVGFPIPDLFIVGYGLNYGDHYRNIPYIYTYVDK